mmetsp:Transcript_12367/g.34039  ORF Transcript_12367/g.34039 Transcript_12367/m.34039 type:complete len:249 (-) Transcript_12367:251-997(-)
MFTKSCIPAVALAVQLLLLVVEDSTAFVPLHTRRATPAFVQRQQHGSQLLASESEDNYLMKVDDGDEGVEIPFIDETGSSFIDCYADCIAMLEGTEYTIGVPCDYAVALCYYDGDNLVPVEMNDPLMDDVFSVAESIVSEEFGEDLSLQRTPQTLTLVGELEDEEDEDEEDDDLDEDESGEEEVELLLSFEFRGKEFNLVRLLDPMLVVAKAEPGREDVRRLLTPEESEKVMPLLEAMFLDFHQDEAL